MTITGNEALKLESWNNENRATYKNRHTGSKSTRLLAEANALRRA